MLLIFLTNYCIYLIPVTPWRRWGYPDRRLSWARRLLSPVIRTNDDSDCHLLYVVLHDLRCLAVRRQPLTVICSMVLSGIPWPTRTLSPQLV